MPPSKHGFTLIETMIVLVVAVILGIVILPNFFGARTQADLSNTTKQAVALLREAQSQSTAQVNETSWSVYFSNATNTTAFYALVASSSYATSSVTDRYTLPPDVCYGNIAQGASTTIVFSQISGAPATSSMVSLVSYHGGSCASSTGATTTITVTSQGAISF